MQMNISNQMVFHFNKQFGALVTMCHRNLTRENERIKCQFQLMNEIYPIICRKVDFCHIEMVHRRILPTPRGFLDIEIGNIDYERIRKVNLVDYC
jgi:hypothetical protein